MIIEQVTVADAEELLEIYRPYVEKTAITFEYDVPSVSEFEGRIKEISAKYPYIKAVEDGQITGYAYAGVFKGRRAYDWSVETTVYVKEDRKGEGIGRALYAKLEEMLKEMGVLNMNACIGVPRKRLSLNRDACKEADNICPEEKPDETISYDSVFFHEKMGFEMVGRFHDSGYKFGKWYDMVWMEKMIGDHNENCGNVRFGMHFGTK